MTTIPFLDSKTTRGSTTWWICAGLVLSIVAAYWPVAGYAFTYYDDNDYVWQNPHVLNGLSRPDVVWAFTHFFVGNWHPLTWLSHMLDAQLFGLNAGAHHVTNVVFHAANTVLVFLWLKRATGFVWRSALVAALFGLHPLHVESVAWVAERKDVLSTFFLLLSLTAYTRYVRKSEVGSQKPEINLPSPISFLQSPFFWLSLVFFALGLMSKPMLVTLPFVLLLLDFWPLERIRNFKRLLLEKTPFFLLSAGSCVVTYFAQQSSQAVATVAALPFDVRIENALISYVFYLKKMLWPDALAAFYPLSYPIDADEVVVSVFVLLLVSAGVFAFCRRRSYLLTGWLWYLGTLVPVIGLVQVGAQSMADRYTYVPLIGVFIAIIWLVAELSTEWPQRRLILTILSVSVLGTCWQLTASQVRYWQNDETLSRHALAVTTDNTPMQVLLGNALFKQGKAEEASQHFAEALRIWPDNVTATYNLAMTLVAQGKLEEAADACKETLKFHPSETKIHWLLGNIFSQQGKRAEAITEYQAVLQINSNYLFALNDLAWLLATAPDPRLRDGPEAVRLAEKACGLSNYRTTTYVGTLAAAYAEAGRFDDAVKTAQKAIALATAAKIEGLAYKNRELLELYQNKKAYHEPTGH